MTKNMFWVRVLNRPNPIKEFFYNLFSAFSSYPRLLIEVFIRKDFGERYFNWGSALIAAFVFSFIPCLIYIGESFSNLRMPNFIDFFKEFALWYVYLFAFLLVSYRRWKETKRLPGVYDFAKFTKNRGKINQSFYNIPIFNKMPTQRQVEILIEPGLFFLIGLVFCFIGQGAGLMLIICSLFYSLSYAADYHAGDNFIMDIIDNWYLTKEMQEDFFQTKIDPNDPRARNEDCRYRIPADEKSRQIVWDAVIINDREKDSSVAE